MGLTAYSISLSLYLVLSSHWFILKPLQLTLEPLLLFVTIYKNLSM